MLLYVLLQGQPSEGALQPPAHLSHEALSVMHNGQVLSLSYSQDGKLLGVAAEHDEHVSVVAPDTLVEIDKYRHSGIWHLRFAQGVHALALCGTDDISVWDVDRRLVSLLPTRREHGMETAYECPVFGADRKLLVASKGGANGRPLISEWDIDARRQMRTFEEHASPIMSMDVTPDGACMVSADLSGNVVLWDLVTGIVRQRLTAR